MRLPDSWGDNSYEKVWGCGHSEGAGSRVVHLGSSLPPSLGTRAWGAEGAADSTGQIA